MIDEQKRLQKQRDIEKTRKRMQVTIDLDNYEYVSEKKHTDYYDNDINQRVAIYVCVSTDDVKQTTSYELQKKYYEDFVLHHPNWTLVKIYADEGISGTSLKHRDEMTVPEMCVLLYLNRCRNADDPHFSCPSMSKMCFALNLAKGTIRKSIKWLEQQRLYIQKKSLYFTGRRLRKQPLPFIHSFGTL